MKKMIRNLSTLMLLALISCQEKEVTPDREPNPEPQFQSNSKEVSGQSPYRLPSNCDDDFGLCSIEPYDPDHSGDLWEVIMEEPVETDTGKTMVIGIPELPHHSSQNLVIDEPYLVDSELAEELDYKDLKIQPGTYEVSNHSSWEGTTTVSITGTKIIGH